MKTTKFLLPTLIAAAAMTATAFATDYTWDSSQDYTFTWDFSQSNTQNGQTGVLGGTVSNTFVTEVVDIISSTAIKKGDSTGQYWETGTNSFFYDALNFVTTSGTTASLTFTVDYYYTGAQWGENILHIGKDGTGIALGLAKSGYVSFGTGTATDNTFVTSDIQLEANTWTTISWTISNGGWSATVGESTSDTTSIGSISWDSSADERNKYSIGVKAPGWNSGATGLNDSGCKIANLSVSYSGVTVRDLIWGGEDVGTWTDESWNSGSDTGVAISENSNVTFSKTVAMTADTDVSLPSVTVEKDATLTLAGEGIVSASTVTVNGNLSVSTDSTLVSNNTISLAESSILSGGGKIDLGSAGVITLNGAELDLSDSGFSDWSGTIVISERASLTDFSFDKYVTSGSKVEVTGLAGWLNSFTSTLGEVVLTDSSSDSAFKVTNGSSKGKYSFAGKISGAGTFEHAWTGGTGGCEYTFSGDISEWTGAFKHSASGKTNKVIFSENILSITTGISVAAGILEVEFGNDDATYSGEISGETGASMSLSTSGTLTIDGSFANKGTTVLASGTILWKAENTLGNTHHTVSVGSDALLDLTQGSSLFSGAEHVSNGRLTVQGKVKVANTNWETGTSFGKLQHNSDTISVDGGEIVYTLTHTASRALNFTANGGKITIEDGQSVVFEGNENGDAFITDASGGTLAFNTVGDAEVSGTRGVIQGGAGIEKTGAGMLTLSGSNSYSGGTTISAGKLVAANANALGDAGGAVTISGGQLSVSQNVTLAQTAITIVLNDAYNTENTEKIAAISGAGAFADGTTITLDKAADAVALSLVAEAPQKYSYQIFDPTSSLVGTDWTFELGSAWDGWEQSYDTTSGVLTLTIPEPSAFGLLAGVGALALVVARRKRRK
ncbi:MAG: autotransporter-associated beta strand repeat-containing protein [Opitutales bacterium]|nr:autotransporter-associated beta strand repeat-containing protein [Opitutales bacterium]